MKIKKVGCGLDWSSYKELKEFHVVSQGWGEYGDLSFLFHQPEDLQKYIDVVSCWSQSGKNAFRQMMQDISAHDIILAFEGNSVKGIAEVPERFVYYFDDEIESYKNCLFPLNWVDWEDFCKDPNIRGQGGQGVKGIENCNSPEKLVEYIHQHWKSYKEKSGYVLQLDSCNDKLNELLNNLDLRQKKSKTEFIKKMEKNIQQIRIRQIREILEHNRNLILTGAPGTGKTYLAKQIAEEMGCSDDEIGFVQFHPSYDYTDFVEGLRPKQDETSGSNIGFERRNGVLKDFCTRALIKQSEESIKQKDGSAPESMLNSNPTVWKVSLKGTGDNPIRHDCLEKGYIRIGWHEYGDVEDFNEFDDYTQYGGKNVLKAFQNQMKEGDIIASCYSESEVDAIGIVTGGYEYDEKFGEYPRYRKVHWLVKNIRENILAINDNKKFTPSTVYKSNITAEDALKIVGKQKSTHVDSTSSNVTKVASSCKPFVFIIDEINRGEISKIFGELFFSIDPGYRGEKGRVQTQYQNMVEGGDAFKKGFYIPENVYIIGTMNDIDRSVESMDFAFRRRFAFMEVTAEDSKKMLDSEDVWKDKDGKFNKPMQETIDKIKNRMDNLNAAIESIEGLSSAYHVGASYFLKLKNYISNNGEYDQESFNKLWKYHLKGLLFEYLRGMQCPNEKLDDFYKAYQNEQALVKNNTNGQTQDN